MLAQVVRYSDVSYYNPYVHTGSTHTFRSIRHLPVSKLDGTRVILRADLNVPLENGVVTDDFRIKRVTQTIEYLRLHKAKVIIISHIGRDPKESLRPVYEYMKAHSSGLVFVPDMLGAAVTSVVDSMEEGDAILLENLRRYPGEEANDMSFAKSLASLADIYINDAFSAAHREHASIVTLPKLLPCYAGLLLEDEVTHLSVALNPPKPALCIIGGAKFDTKEPLIRRLLEAYGFVFIGGALANDVFKARGFPVGISKVGDRPPADDVLAHPGLIVPTDVIAAKPDKQSKRKLPRDVEDDETIADIGPDSIANLVPRIMEAKFILWNGPMGRYEDGFDVATEMLAEAVSQSSARTVVGGGDTIAAIKNKGLDKKFWFLSTGGGAMLEYLLQGTLPGIEALKQPHH